MLHFPVFNEDHRDKWVSKKSMSYEGYKVEKSTLWKEIHNCNIAGKEPYIGGL